MFTGLVLEVGRVERFTPLGGGAARLTVAMSEGLAGRLDLGASVAVDGACLTVAGGEGATRDFDLSPETVARTTLGGLREGVGVHLEPALRLGDPLGGHWVQGHVDGVVEVVALADEGDSVRMGFELPARHRAEVVEKGSVTLHGVSLTVAKLDEDSFEVALIPHTLEVTTFGELAEGDRVNFEADVLARYVARAVEVHAGGRRSGSS